MATTMTIHEALCRVKVNTDRINEKIAETAFCSVKKCNQSKFNGVDLNVFTNDVKSTYNSIRDLIKFTDAVKAAISLSNAQTKVTVAGKEMTVAEVLYQMKYGLNVKKNLLQVLNKQYKNCMKKIEIENGEKLDDGLKRYLESSVGGKDKIGKEDLTAITDVYIKNNSWEMVDPIKISDEIQKLQKEIDDFESTADSAIQVSNATTTITIDV